MQPYAVVVTFKNREATLGVHFKTEEEQAEMLKGFESYLTSRAAVAFCSQGLVLPYEDVLFMHLKSGEIEDPPTPNWWERLKFWGKEG